MCREDDARVRIRLLGGFGFTNTAKATEHWKSGRARTLFAYLLVNRNRMVLKERLHEVLWPGVPYDPDNSGLKVTVHTLRKALADRTRRGDRTFEVVYEDYGYALRTDGTVWVDVEEFERMANQTRIAEGCREWTTVAELCERAATVYRGDFLAGESGAWIAGQREWLRSVALRVLRLLTRHAIHQHDQAGALGYCRRTLDIDPCDEETYRTLMLVHATRGELGQVKRWHDLCTQRLAEHLDIAPAGATEQLLRRALGSKLVDATESINSLNAFFPLGDSDLPGAVDTVLPIEQRSLT